MWRSATCPSPFLQCAQSTPPSLLGVLFSSLFIIHFFFFCGARVSLSRALCWFIPGLTIVVGLPCATYLLTCWSVSPKQVWSLCLVAWESSCLLSVTWCGEAFYGLGVQDVRVLLLFFFFSAKCGSSISARFLIYGAHVYFLPLVAILDPLPIIYILRHDLAVKTRLVSYL
jgi:hypothetical protein